jgi:hypothetical protein
LKIIKVSSAGTKINNSLWIRQTPNSSGVWGDCKFIFNEKLDECDWWIVLHGSGLRVTETVKCDPSHTIYVSMEPNEIIGNISDGFRNQFSHIVSTDRSIAHKNIFYKFFHSWWVGMSVKHTKGQHYFEPTCNYDYDAFSNIEFKDKLDRISIVTSTRNVMQGHTDRLRFIDKLMASSLSSSIDLYGGGFNPIDDKLDAIKNHKYHLVIENDIIDDYWTEKIADSFLGEALPIYHGAPNIEKYFSRQSLIEVDVRNIDSTIRSMSNTLEYNIYEKSRPAIIESKNLILNRYNIFNELSILCNKHGQSAEKITLRPNRKFVEGMLRGFIKDIYFRYK